MTLASLDVSSKKRWLYRHFTYHLKAHTISNKLVSKVSVQKKGGKVMTATNMCSNFGSKWSGPPMDWFDFFKLFQQSDNERVKSLVWLTLLC